MTPEAKLRKAATLMAARLQINRAYRKALEECGETEVVLPMDEFFGVKEREALSLYEEAVHELLGMQPLPLEMSA